MATEESADRIKTMATDDRIDDGADALETAGSADLAQDPDGADALPTAGGSEPSASAADQHDTLRYHLQKGIRHFRAAEYRQSAHEMKAALKLDPHDLTAGQYLSDVREIHNTLRAAVQDYNARNFSGCMAAVQRVLELNPADPNAAALSTKLPALMQERTPPSARDLGLVPVWSTNSGSGVSSGSAVAQQEKLSRRSKIVILVAVGLLVLQIPLVLYVLSRRATTSPGTSEQGKRARADPLALAKDAMGLVRQERFAAALGLLEEARRAATRSGEVGSLREREAEIRMEMATRLLGKGNEVAAKAELERVLELSPGHAQASAVLARIKAKAAQDGLRGAAIAAHSADLRGARAATPPVSQKPRRQATASHHATPKTKPAAAGAAPRAEPAAPEPTAGKLRVEASEPCGIFVDGVDTGKQTPALLSLPPGVHTIAARSLRDGIAQKQQRVTVKAGTSSTLAFTLRARVPGSIDTDNPYSKGN